MESTPRKPIKVLDRKMILTSRGLVRGPILHPYQEKIDAIFTMLSKYDANIVEVLPNGKEVALTLQNFNKDNSVEVQEVIPTVETRKTEPERAIEPNQAIDARMSRKERKRLEHERRIKEEAAAQASKEEEVKSEEIKDETPIQGVNEETPQETKDKDTTTEVNE